MISLIVAHDKNRVIGLNGDMPWGKSLHSDLQWFKKHTSNKIVVMGRKTFESIGRPLPNRINVILTTDDSKTEYYREQVCYVSHSVDEVLSDWTTSDRETFIIGGSEVYKAFLPYVDRLYVTQIDHEFEGDTLFPEYDLSDCQSIFECEDVTGLYPLKFAIYEFNKTKNSN